MADKKAHERAAFLQFLTAAGLQVDPATIEVRDSPDILCVVGGRPEYFELGRLLDPMIPILRLEMLRVAPKPVAMDVMKFHLPERVVLQKKLATRYETNGLPVDLVLYYDFDQTNLLTASFPVESIESYARHVWMPLIAESPNVFRRVWVFERHRGTVLWVSPPHLSRLGTEQDPPSPSRPAR